MPSPFPGMDPYLEDQHYWEEFHSKFMNWAQDTLAEQVPEAYEVRIEEPRVPHRRRRSDFQANSSSQMAAVLRQPGVGSAPVSAANALTLVPVSLSLPMYELEEVIEHRIEIRHRPDRVLVTVIELLSPSNKEPPGDRLYSRKRLELIHQVVHLVELDFLIGGKRLKMEDELPNGTLLCPGRRAELRPRSGRVRVVDPRPAADDSDSLVGPRRRHPARPGGNLRHGFFSGAVMIWSIDL